MLLCLWKSVLREVFIDNAIVHQKRNVTSKTVNEFVFAKKFIVLFYYLI